ncbi:MAG: sortase [bacterium]|nr:sortase [bacterium]
MSVFFKYFLILSAIFLVIFNWGYVDWFFNYNTIEENLGNLSINTGSAFSTPVISTPIIVDATKPVVVDTTKPSPVVKPQVSTTETSYISIAKIGVKSPVSFTTSNSQKVFSGLLKLGVLHYTGSTMPGEIGTAIILGHSAPPNWPKINYDSVFNNLNALKPGDEILINYQGNEYKYLVNKTFWVQKGEDLTFALTFNRSMLLLVSCWPPGKNLQRIVVEAELNNN